MPITAGVRGLSVVVCCHNSAARLPETLAHLAAQEAGGRPWELIVVDNASTDRTAAVAHQCWPATHPAPLRIVAEPEPGLSAARRVALAAARHELVSFIDDDNHAAPDWVATASALMEDDARLGACGGFNVVRSAATLPVWFPRYAWSYAVGPQAEPPDLAADVASLWGAGLTIRKTAWQHLTASGFVPRLSGRAGAALSGAEDTELCLALRLTGWRLRYEPGLRLAHALAPSRLTWPYLRSLHRAFGASAPLLDPYWAALGEAELAKRPAHVRTWLWQGLSAARWLASHPATCMAAMQHRGEGDPRILNLEGQVGKLGTLLRLHRRYDRAFDEVASAPWRKPEAASLRGA